MAREAFLSEESRRVGEFDAEGEEVFVGADGGLADPLFGASWKGLSDVADGAGEAFVVEGGGGPGASDTTGRGDGGVGAQEQRHREGGANCRRERALEESWGSLLAHR